MTMLRSLLATAALLALAGCGARFGAEDDDSWRPFRANSPIFSPGGSLEREQVPSSYGSRLTVPRLIGGAPEPAPMQAEDGNIWPDPEPPRNTLTDPSAVARGVPNFQPPNVQYQGRPPPPAFRGTETRPDPTPRGSQPGAIIQRPDGRPAITGAGTDGVWTYGVPGRPGVGTAIPDGRGGQILMEPGGGTVIAPR